MKHLVGIKDLSKTEIENIFARTDHFTKGIRSGDWDKESLRHKVILILFFEASTRTLTSFDMAAKRLGAEVVNWNPENSSLKKGETFGDTIATLSTMGPDAVIIRHSEFGAPEYASKRMSCPVINAGDSWNEHPTQALLDGFTIRQHFGKIEGLTIAMTGDIAHSRVASSNMALLSKMGAHVRIIAPSVLMPDKLPVENIQKFETLDEGIQDADVVMSIRLHKERMDQSMITEDTYFRDYGLTHEKLQGAKKTAVVMDPGPFLRGVQISDDLADDPERFLYFKQIQNSIPTRMAVLDMLVNGS